MSNKQSALRDSAAVQQHLEDKQVNLFIFDLKNEAAERGFKQDNAWTLQLASEEEMAGLKRLYVPLLSLRLKNKNLLNVFSRVRTELQQALTETELAIAAVEIERKDKAFIAAYPAKMAIK